MPSSALLVIVAVALTAGSCAGINGGAGTGGGGAGGNLPILQNDGGGSDLAPIDAHAETGEGVDMAIDVQGGCRNLACQQTSCKVGGCQQQPCANGAKTTVSGTVYDPAGDVPLYGIAVFVPNAPLSPLPQGVACTHCQATIENALSVALTDVKGNFVLDDVPVGENIPMVMEVGKWRRAVTIDVVAACTNTPLNDPNFTRLPRNQSEGDLPKIALTTGGHDALECLLRKVGIDDSEFSPTDGKGHVNLFAGEGGTDRYAPSLNGGAMFTPVQPWWDSVDNLKPYDMILYSCEGNPKATNKSAAAVKAFQAYAEAGGRSFASHWHNYWFEQAAPPLSTVATFDNQTSPLSEYPSMVDVSFPKGAAMADWLNNVGATPTRGQLTIEGARNTVTALDSGLAQKWLYGDSPSTVQYFSANTPIGSVEDQQCGRVVYSDIHVSSGAKPGFPRDRSLNGPGDPDLGFPFPTGCVTQGMTPQELALVFMLFDMQSCILGGVPVIP
ncbi:MAG TPA: carboxypeptidase regulatory-like domain-containing protein [Polyangia bacterium]|nr:carboxypeptidase regulatory-like domain-containing protein [Polyangia bacterium]